VELTPKDHEEETPDMRKTGYRMVAAAIVGLAAVACNEDLAPSSDQAQVLAAEQEQLGAMIDGDFGAVGAASTAAVGGSGATGSGGSFDVSATQADTAPTFWGRMRVVPRGPRPVYHRDVSIVNDTATVEHDITFNGLFLVDTSADGVFNPTSKPLADRMTQRAVLVRDRSRRHGWRVVQLSPQNWTVVDPSRQTVTVTGVQIYKNGALLLDVNDPGALYDADNRIPRFHVGDTIRVVATVENITAGGFTPPTFVFLHVRHWDRIATAWRRTPMEDNGDGTYQRTWVAQRGGVDRFVVDALDAATLLLGTADNYRASEVGIPYRIE
jgi:hypothetical protein